MAKKRTGPVKKAPQKAAPGEPREGEPLSLETVMGARIKAVRQRRNLSAAQTAKLAGITPGMQSKIEHGTISPSLSTLQRLSRALHVPITLLFEEFEARRDCSYVRAGQGVAVERREQEGQIYELLGHAMAGDITVEPYRVIVKKGATPFPVFMREGHKFVHMMSGKIKYRHGDKVYDLDAGDSLYFDARTLHGPEEFNELPAEYLSIVIYLK